MTFEADGSAASLVTANASAAGGPTESEEKAEPSSGPADGSEAAPGSDTKPTPTRSTARTPSSVATPTSESGTLTDSKGNQVDAGRARSRRRRPRRPPPPTGRSRWPPPWPINIVDSEAIATIPAGLTITATGPLTLIATNDTGDPNNEMGLYGDTANAWGTDAGTAKVGIGAAVALNLVHSIDRGDDPVQQQPAHDDQHPRGDHQRGNARRRSDERVRRHGDLRRGGRATSAWPGRCRSTSSPTPARP